MPPPPPFFAFTTNATTHQISINQEMECFGKKSYFEKNQIEVRYRKKSEFSTDVKIPIRDDQNIEIYGFLDGFVL